MGKQQASKKMADEYSVWMISTTPTGVPYNNLVNYPGPGAFCYEGSEAGVDSLVAQPVNSNIEYGVPGPGACPSDPTKVVWYGSKYVAPGTTRNGAPFQGYWY